MRQSLVRFLGFFGKRMVFRFLKVFTKLCKLKDAGNVIVKETHHELVFKEHRVESIDSRYRLLVLMCILHQEYVPFKNRVPVEVYRGLRCCI